MLDIMPRLQKHKDFKMTAIKGLMAVKATDL